jgi:membrane protease YdiL (CAAX protease family)
MALDARPVRPVVVAHQEGVVGVVALVGLAFRPHGPVAALAPVGQPLAGLLAGLGVGLAGSVLLWLLRSTPPVAALEAFLRRVVVEWTAVDAVAIALLSGLAEEALVRALLQPLIGLWPAALVFALLHLLPDRRLWFWPVMALALGVVLGLLFDRWGYPACAAAHVTLNLVGLLRLR